MISPNMGNPGKILLYQTQNAWSLQGSGSKEARPSGSGEPGERESQERAQSRVVLLSYFS